MPNPKPVRKKQKPRGFAAWTPEQRAAARQRKLAAPVGSGEAAETRSDRTASRLPTSNTSPAGGSIPQSPAGRLPEMSTVIARLTPKQQYKILERINAQSKPK